MYKKYIFVDTSAWFASLDKRDQHHTSASFFLNTPGSPLITTNFIMDEVLTLVNNRLGHQSAIKIGINFLNENIASLFQVDAETQKSAWKIFQKFGDKNFSFTDCTSFAIMEKLKIINVFTFDKHF